MNSVGKLSSHVLGRIYEKHHSSIETECHREDDLQLGVDRLRDRLDASVELGLDTTESVAILVGDEVDSDSEMTETSRTVIIKSISKSERTTMKIL